MQALDVKYLIIHHSAPIDAHGDIEITKGFGDTWIYSLGTPKPEKERLGARIYLPTPVAPGSIYTAFFVLSNHSPLTFAIKPTETLQVEAHWNEHLIQHVTGNLPLLTPHTSVVPIRMTAPEQIGTYHLNLRVAIDGRIVWSYLAGDVEVKNEESAREVVLPVGVSTQATFKSHYAAGEEVLVNLTWLAFGKIDAYYSASVRIIDAQGNKVTNVDREPAGRTFLWRPGDAIPDRFALTLPPTLAPGDYTIQVMMYQAEQSIDALLLDQNFVPQKSLTIGTFTVK
jgi:hypothetical protein